MPFDNATHQYPTPQDLADLLRDRSRWPTRFRWNYQHSATCAIGLCRQVWGDEAFLRFGGTTLPYAFCSVGQHLGKRNCQVTPEDVAAYIERFTPATAGAA